MAIIRQFPRPLLPGISSVNLEGFHLLPGAMSSLDLPHQAVKRPKNEQRRLGGFNRDSKDAIAFSAQAKPERLQLARFPGY